MMKLDLSGVTPTKMSDMAFDGVSNTESSEKKAKPKFNIPLQGIGALNLDDRPDDLAPSYD